MWKEFREFLNRGNVMDLALAVILGAAFGAIVTSLVNDLIMPLVGMILGGIDFTGLVWKVGSAQLKYGSFIQAIVNFLIIAFALFLIVKAYNRMQRKAPEKPAEPTVVVIPQDTLLLTEIRDLLKRERTGSLN